MYDISTHSADDVAAAIDTLPWLEREVMLRRGYGPGNASTYVELSVKFGIAPEYIRWAEKDGLARVNRILAD